MHVHTQIGALKATLRPLQQAGLRIGFVPTMGALHRGHLSLVQQAKASAEVVVASIFVNPTQFGPNEDLSRYPRDLEADRAKLEAVGCHHLFAPTPEQMYPPGFQTRVQVQGLTDGLCGASRPGHFDGVATVVLKLFSIVRPDVAVFGEKDFQQLAVLRRMVEDLDMDVEVQGAPLVREPDGLALSSRNVYLDSAERERALSLSRGLFAAEAAYRAGERRGTVLEQAVHQSLEAQGLTAEYVSLRGYTALDPLEHAQGPCVLLAAVRVGSTRLIDNRILCRP